MKVITVKVPGATDAVPVSFSEDSFLVWLGSPVASVWFLSDNPSLSYNWLAGSSAPAENVVEMIAYGPSYGNQLNIPVQRNRAYFGYFGAGGYYFIYYEPI